MFNDNLFALNYSDSGPWLLRADTFLLRQFPTCKLISKGKHCSGGEKRIKHVCKVWRNDLQALLRNRIFGGGVFLAAPCSRPTLRLTSKLHEHLGFQSLMNESTKRTFRLPCFRCCKRQQRLAASTVYLAVRWTLFKLRSYYSLRETSFLTNYSSHMHVKPLSTSSCSSHSFRVTITE